jgi:hypothetical protein
MKKRASSGLLDFITRLLSLSTAFCLQSPAESWAITADPNSVEYNQPDGAKIKLRLQGDEFFHWREDPDGFTVLLRWREYVYTARRT